MFFTIFRTSDAIAHIQVSPILGVVLVEYTNVSRRAILNLMANPNMSLGFWVNANCNNERAVTHALWLLA